MEWALRTDLTPGPRPQARSDDFLTVRCGLRISEGSECHVQERETDCAMRRSRVARSPCCALLSYRPRSRPRTSRLRTREPNSRARGTPSRSISSTASVEVVGYAPVNSEEVEGQRAHYWMVGPTGNVLVSMELQSLSPADPDAVVSVVSSQAYDVSNQGIVVGYQRDDWGPPRPVLWPDAVAAPVELPLPDATALGAAASSINDEGVVVGDNVHSKWSEACGLESGGR